MSKLATLNLRQRRMRTDAAVAAFHNIGEPYSARMLRNVTRWCARWQSWRCASGMIRHCVGPAYRMFVFEVEP